VVQITSEELTSVGASGAAKAIPTTRTAQNRIFGKKPFALLDFIAIPRRYGLRREAQRHAAFARSKIYRTFGTRLPARKRCRGSRLATALQKLAQNSMDPSNAPASWTAVVLYRFRAHDEQPNIQEHFAHSTMMSLCRPTCVLLHRKSFKPNPHFCPLPLSSLRATLPASGQLPHRRRWPALRPGRPFIIRHWRHLQF
jgi:hypothetical protein